jgi:Flp pilus assembly protein TadD
MNRFLVTLIILSFSVLYGQEEQKAAGDYLRDGIAAMEAEKYTEALTAIRNAIELDSENAQFYRLEGQILEMLDEPESARAAWKLCLQYATDDDLKKEATIHLQTLEE